MPDQTTIAGNSRAFLRDVAEHKTELVSKFGVNRHLRFWASRPDSPGFEVITWPHHLCITGDKGTYVFRGPVDVFAAFRSEKVGIAPWWTGGQLVSFSPETGYTTFSPARFQNYVTRCVQDAWPEDSPAKADTLAEVEARILAHLGSDETKALKALREFYGEPSGFTFPEPSPGEIRELTDAYLWNCRAIVWAFDRYHDLIGGKA